LVSSEGFNTFIAVVILLNAVVLGGGTYAGLSADTQELLTRIDVVLYLVFLAELILRIVSYGRKPWMFFTEGWNVFDFIIIGAVLIPGVREQATVLRLLRLARIARIIRVLPGAQVLIRTLARALPAVGSMVLFTIVLLFVYAMVGWSLFGEALPQAWGDVGRAMLTLFVILTLENLPLYLEQAQAVSDWANVYFLSYVLVAAFVIVNLFIGVVVSAMDEVRAEDRDDQETAAEEALSEQIAQLQRTVDQLAASLEGTHSRSSDPRT